MIKKQFLENMIVFILTSLTATIGIVVDGLIIGNCLETSELAAYGMVSPVFMIIMAIGSVLATGMQMLCARNISRGDLEESNKIFSTTMITGVCIGILLMIICFGASSNSNLMSKLFGVSDALLEGSQEYLKGLTFGFPGMIVTACLQPIMRLDGDKSRALYSAIALTVANVCADLVCVFVFNGGLLGMALATSFSYYVAVAVCLLHFVAKNRNFKFGIRKLNCKLIKTIVFTGFPVVVSIICQSIRTYVINHMLLNTSGKLAVAAFTVQANANSLFGAVGMGIGASVALLTAVYYGEENKDIIAEVYKTALRYAMIYTTIVGVIVFAFSGTIAQIYVGNNPDALSLTTRSLQLFAISVPLTAINIVVLNFFQGSGQIRRIVIGSVMSDFFIIVAAVFLSKIFMTDGIWVSFAAGRILVLIFYYLWVLEYHRRLPRQILDFLFLPREYGVSEGNYMTMYANDKKTIYEIHNQIYDFCKSHQLDRRTVFYTTLCAEEILKNIEEYGFGDGKKHHVMVSVILKKGMISVKIQDDCKPFNPEQWLKLHSGGENNFEHIGIRMIFNVAEHINYVNAIGINKLTINQRIKEGNYA